MRSKRREASLTAADDALTREIEALRDSLVATGRELAHERDRQEANRRDLAEIRENLEDLAAANIHLTAVLAQLLEPRHD
jgi:predicted  nucleic acid-binding Zn-ribbon protein